MIEGVEETAGQQILEILCTGEGEEGSLMQTMDMDVIRLYFSLLNYLFAVFVMPN